jgi:hypothetical protein
MTMTATTPLLTASRRDLLLAGVATMVASLLPAMTLAADPPIQINTEIPDMSFIKA